MTEHSNTEIAHVSLAGDRGACSRTYPSSCIGGRTRLCGWFGADNFSEVKNAPPRDHPAWLLAAPNVCSGRPVALGSAMTKLLRFTESPCGASSCADQLS